jgi:hypothetical protein
MNQPAERKARFEKRCILERKRWEYAAHEKNERSDTTEA